MTKSSPFFFVAGFEARFAARTLFEKFRLLGWVRDLVQIGASGTGYLGTFIGFFTAPDIQACSDYEHQ